MLQDKKKEKKRQANITHITTTCTDWRNSKTCQYIDAVSEINPSVSGNRGDNAHSVSRMDKPLRADSRGNLFYGFAKQIITSTFIRYFKWPFKDKRISTPCHHWSFHKTSPKELYPLLATTKISVPKNCVVFLQITTSITVCHKSWFFLRRIKAEVDFTWSNLTTNALLSIVHLDCW